MSFVCLRVHRDENRKQKPAVLETKEDSPLDLGQVRIRVHFSSVNFKDALAITGKGKILRKLPLIPGIDLCGEIIEVGASVREFSVGDAIVATGCGLGETIDGGFTEIAVLPEHILVPLPTGLSFEEAMLLGTAGFTSALCLQRMLDNRQTPDMGPILITGASGGVGTIAIQILKQNGFTVHAFSGRKEHSTFLESLGADRVIHPDEINLGTSPLESARYGGAIDNLGGDTLSGILRHVNLWGNVASVGLAQSHELHGTVMPHILRGVSLLGISSANCPMPLRREIWGKLASAWKPKGLQDIKTSVIGLHQLNEIAAKILDRESHGRILVDCQKTK